MIKVLAISGYKPFELGIFKKDHPSVQFIKLAFKKALLPLIEEGLEWVLISGQLGAELWAAEVLFELQFENPELKLAVITPFLDQQASWNENNKEWYESVLAQADFIDSVTKKGYEKPWQFRIKNQFFIEKSDGLLLFFDHEKEGSPKYLYEMAMEYQNKHDYPVELITFYDLQMIVEEEQLKEIDKSTYF
ncbi:putative phage-like protein YoqJ [Bacillus sp. SORGH_AS 510]|nr:putative phage-like protein YoqJ [Bacillus sp. SORGH_AS_0510]